MSTPTSTPARTNRSWTSGMLSTEDWWSVWVGLALFAAGLTALAGLDLVGWMPRTRLWEWTALTRAFEWSKLFAPAGAGYAAWHPLVSWLTAYALFAGAFTAGAYFQGVNPKRFLYGFTVLFVLTWVAWLAGNELHLTSANATVDGRNVYTDAGLTWGLQLGEGSTLMIALAIGLVIGNFFKGFAASLAPAAKPEWFIKAAIVLLGANLGGQILQASRFALDLVLTGAAATFVAYLFFWPIVYTIARRGFKLQRDASAVLASGISVCGVSAAIATAGAIRARPVIPVTVSILVVIFAMLEILVLPGAYTALFPDQPIVNGAALGMTVKTDGADAAAGALLEQLMLARNVALGNEPWAAGWILSSSILTKLWIDVFIGVWAFLLALIWITKVEKRAGAVTIGPSEIWFRFPKFVIGYIMACVAYLLIATTWPDLRASLAAGTSIVAGPMRTMLFMLTFVAMGTITDFSKLKGMGRLAVLYAIALIVIIAPIAYGIAYLFHRGLQPPLAQ